MGEYSSLKKNFSFLLCFTPVKLNFFFSSILNFPSKIRLAGVCFSCAACLCGLENFSHIKERSASIKIELKKKLSFIGVKHNKSEKFFFRDEYYWNIFDIYNFGLAKIPHWRRSLMHLRLILHFCSLEQFSFKMHISSCWLCDPDWWPLSGPPNSRWLPDLCTIYLFFERFS